MSERVLVFTPFSWSLAVTRTLVNFISWARPQRRVPWYLEFAHRRSCPHFASTVFFSDSGPGVPWSRIINNMPHTCTVLAKLLFPGALSSTICCSGLRHTAYKDEFFKWMDTTGSLSNKACKITPWLWLHPNNPKKKCRKPAPESHSTALSLQYQKPLSFPRC